jgi:hypothetical protein
VKKISIRKAGQVRLTGSMRRFMEHSAFSDSVSGGAFANYFRGGPSVAAP